MRTLAKALKSNLVKDGVTPTQAYRIPMAVMRTIARYVQQQYELNSDIRTLSLPCDVQT